MTFEIERMDANPTNGLSYERSFTVHLTFTAGQREVASGTAPLLQRSEHSSNHRFNRTLPMNDRSSKCAPETLAGIAGKIRLHPLGAHLRRDPQRRKHRRGMEVRAVFDKSAEIGGWKNFQEASRVFGVGR